MNPASLPPYLQPEPDWVQRIHSFWFGQQDVYEEEYEHLFRRWYRGGPRLDQEILDLFGPQVEEVAQSHADGDFATWRVGPQGDAALVILLDQMSRNMYRGDARMFATDPIAQGLVFDLLDDGSYNALAPIQQLFCCVALEHAEDADVVRRSHTLMCALADVAPAPQRQRFVSMCRYNKQHLDIVEAFGRYPHRNHLLGRETTPAEAAFLQETNYRFMRSVNKGYK